MAPTHSRSTYAAVCLTAKGLCLLAFTCSLVTLPKLEAAMTSRSLLFLLLSVSSVSGAWSDTGEKDLLALATESAL